jgi:hypothetical protein
MAKKQPFICRLSALQVSEHFLPELDNSVNKIKIGLVFTKLWPIYWSNGYDFVIFAEV